MALNEGAVERPSMPQTITEGFSLEVAPSGQLKSNGFEWLDFLSFSFFLFF